MLKNKKNLAVLLFLFIGIGLLFRAYALKDTYFFDWDEGIYATISQEMIQNTSLQTTFRGETWINKPPITHIILAGFFAVIPDNEFAGRLFMAIVACITALFTWILTKRTMENTLADRLHRLPQWEREIAHLLPVMVMFSTPLFIERSTQLNTDVFLVMAWLGYFIWRDSYWIRVFFIALGTMSKSLLGLYPLGFEFLMLRKESFTKKGLLRGVGVLIIPLLWHIFNYIKFGEYFLSAHVYDQVVSRLVEPIELHFGGRFYYPELTLENFTIISIVIVGGYLLFAHDVLNFNIMGKPKEVVKRFLEAWNSLYRFDYLILLSAIPFYILLLFVQSKVSWYLASAIPLLAIVVSYVYIRMSHKLIRMGLLFLIVGMFVYRFIPGTYAFKPDYTTPDLIIAAECLKEYDIDNLGQLVNHDERSRRDFLEAGNLHTATSFIYGGSPSLAYYMNRDYTVEYEFENFATGYDEYDGFLISRHDLTVTDPSMTDHERAVFEDELRSKYEQVCDTYDWKGFIRKEEE